MATLEENLSPEVLEKVKASLAVTSKVNVVSKETGTATELDIDPIFGSYTKDESISLLPEQIEQKDKEVELALQECAQLTKEADQFIQDYVFRGNQALYKLLTNIYGFAIRVQLSEYHQHIITTMTSVLKERDVKVQVNTSNLMIIVKYIVGNDRRRASNYCRVLEIAMKENLAPKGLADYITRRGGIGNIYATEQDISAKQIGDKLQSKRQGIFRNILINKAFDSTNEITYSSPLIPLSSDDDLKRSDFVFFMTRYDKSKKIYKVIGAHQFGEAFEGTIIRFMTRGNKKDTESLVQLMHAHQDSIIEKKLVPAVIANIWLTSPLRKQLNAPPSTPVVSDACVDL